MSTPCTPSTITSSPSRTICRAVCAPTMAGMLRLRARMAVWEVTPPRSVTKPAYWCCLNSIMSAGDRSCATTISFSARAGAAPLRPGCPCITLSRRSTTCTTSAFLSRR